MNRFAILIHDYPFLHWDFLLENGERCRTWRLLSDPALGSVQIQAEELPDHRLLYLDFSGPVTGNRGTVIQWDAGTFEWRRNQRDLCEVVVAGTCWRHAVRIERIDRNDWRLTIIE